MGASGEVLRFRGLLHPNSRLFHEFHESFSVSRLSRSRYCRLSSLSFSSNSNSNTSTVHFLPSSSFSTSTITNPYYFRIRRQFRQSSYSPYPNSPISASANSNSFSFSFSPFSTCSCVCYAAKAQKPILKQPSLEKSKEVVDVWKNMTVRQLANVVRRPIDTVYEAMLYVPNADQYDSASTPIDDVQIIREIVKKLGVRSRIVAAPDPKSSSSSSSASTSTAQELKPRPVIAKDLVARPPVVAIMGHVDHGKTTLLDALRHTAVAASEAGGITQHIGAFVVETENGKQITFLDTPGHAAFSALRQRGANGADLVILVVAADDGVMEQTKESIRMIKEAKVPMIVAINKIDKQQSDVERAKKMLLQEGIQLEDFNGDVQCVPISASKGTNLQTLVEAVQVQAELMNLQSEGRGPIEGVVLESRVDPGRGRLCTALVQRGVLRKSAILVAGTAWAKVRGMFDEKGKSLMKATPSTPVEIIGWRDLPSAGDEIYEVESERIAKAVIEMRSQKEMLEKAKSDAPAIEQKQQEHEKAFKAMLEEKRKLGRFRLKKTGPRTKEIPDDDTIHLPLVIKADVDGSVEALLDVLETYDCHDQCRLDVVHYGVGDISESDIKLAETFSAVIYGFSVKISEILKSHCKSQEIEFRLSNVIYRLIEAIKDDIAKRLPPKKSEEVLGEANVLALFKVTEGKKKLVVAGSRCTKGQLKRDSRFRIVREDGEHEEIVFDGTLTSMRHLKAEVDTVKNGVECGLCFSDETIVPQEGDVVVCYHLLDVPQKSEWDPGF